MNIPEDKLLETFGVDLDTGAVAPTDATGDPAKCKPHDWRLPALGDEALFCERCGRTITYWAQMTDDIRASICNGIHARHGEVDYRAFTAALREAQRAASDAGAAEWDRDGLLRRLRETGPIKVGGRMVPLKDRKRTGRYA